MPRRDTQGEMYVAVLSNDGHIGAETGRVIVCPFIPGTQPPSGLTMLVAVTQPQGYLLPELIQALPSSALDDAIGAAGATALFEAVMIVNNLMA